MENKTNSISVRGMCGAITGFLWFNASFFLFSGIIYAVWYGDSDKAITRIAVSLISLGFGGILFALINLLPKTEEEMNEERIDAAMRWQGGRSSGQVQTGDPQTGSNLYDQRYQLKVDKS